MPGITTSTYLYTLYCSPTPTNHPIPGEYHRERARVYRVGTGLVGVGILGGVIGCIIQSSNPLYSPGIPSISIGIVWGGTPREYRVY